jgi:hypothetical protein
MEKGKKILTALEGHQIFSTTRGTTGDAQGMLLVDENAIKNLKNASVCTLHELREINALAYADCVDYINNDPILSSWDKDDFLVIYQDCDYLLVWEQD